jgi:hypothetical protein
MGSGGQQKLLQDEAVYMDKPSKLMLQILPTWNMNEKSLSDARSDE